MEKEKFDIYSKTPCLIFCNNEFLGEASIDSCVKLWVLEGETKRVEIFPKTTKDSIYFIAFVAEICSHPKQNQNYELFDLLDGNYEIWLCPHLELRMPSSFEKVFEEERKETKISVLSSTLTKIVLENKKNKIEFCPKHILKDIVCKIFSADADFFILSAKTQNNLQYMFVASLQDITLCCQKVCDDICFDLPKISVTQLCHDFFEHAITEKFELCAKGLNRLKIYSSRKEISAFPAIKNSDIPKIFFECIKCRDYDLARALMTNQLSNSLSDQHLKHFFPKFKQIKVLPNRNGVLLCGNENTYFHFSFDDNKIDNIEIIER